MTDAFYTQLDDNRFAAQWHTVGPWTADAQHLGPPSALLTRALEQVNAGFGGLLSSITVDVLGPVPVGELTVSARLERPGRSVELLAAELHAVAADRTVARATAWRIAPADTASVAVETVKPLSGPETAEPMKLPDAWGRGYLDAMEWRTLDGALGAIGPATLWARQRVPLVAGEEPSPLQRLMTVADSGNGASGTLDPMHWWFINTQLAVHVHREPEGEWIGLDAETVIGAGGVGTARSVLHDVHGQVGGGSQPLMVRPR